MKISVMGDKLVMLAGEPFPLYSSRHSTNNKIQLKFAAQSLATLQAQAALHGLLLCFAPQKSSLNALNVQVCQASTLGTWNELQPSLQTCLSSIKLQPLYCTQEDVYACNR